MLEFIAGLICGKIFFGGSSDSKGAVITEEDKNNPDLDFEDEDTEADEVDYEDDDRVEYTMSRKERIGFAVFVLALILGGSLAIIFCGG